jgi:hypothetical protein
MTNHPSRNTIRTYRVNTGAMTTKTFEASSVAEACSWVRENSFPNYALPRWLEVKAQSVWVRVVDGEAV